MQISPIKRNMLNKNYLQPLTLNNKHFPNNIIQGPLAGVSNAAFRLLTWRLSCPAFSCTEMMSCKTIIQESPAKLARFIKKDPEEGPVSFQLSSNNPYELQEAVKRVTDLGADLIDLNCGCPVKKIRSKGAGSSLLTRTNELYALISAMKQNTHVPVSIKIRVEGKSPDKFHHDIVNVIKDAGADFLIVHGRHWHEDYKTKPHFDQIQFFVESLTIPVIGNGDIACLASLQQMFATGCAGVMISRAGVGQPWLIAKLMAEMNQENFIEPNLFAISHLLIEHTERLIALLNNELTAIREMRKIAKYYARKLPNKILFCEQINQCEEFISFKKIVNHYFCNT